MMYKFFVTLTLLLTFCIAANAQKNVKLVYYLKNSGKLVTNKDSADYWMVVAPPDSSVNKKLYVVYEYYPSGKVRLVTNSKTKDINLLYHGSYVAYFENGHKRKMGRFDAGQPAGHEVEYFPNGQLHSTLDYDKEHNIIYRECRDSTGRTMAENGSGAWRQFDNSFKNIIAEGKVDSGFRVGSWHLQQNDTISYDNKYDKGKIILSCKHTQGQPDLYEKAEADPSFPGGQKAFDEFRMKNFTFPETARLQNISGTTLISFVVEEDGRLTNFKFLSKVGYGVDEALMAAVKQSPPWIPGMVNGKPVRTLQTHSSVFTTTISARVRRM